MATETRKTEFVPFCLGSPYGSPGLSKLVPLLLGGLLFLASPVAAQVRQVRRVLILDDLGAISSPGFAEVDQAVFLALQESPYRIELYHESLELTLFPDEESQRGFREAFVRKYSLRKPDVIVAAGSASLRFIADLQQGSPRDTPIVFCAILGELPDQLKPDMHFTGVLGRLHPEETLRVALEMLPGTQHVVVVGGGGKFDEAIEGIAKQGFHNYESKLEFTYLTNLAMPALLERLKQPPSNTIVYHTAITQDAAGERFIDSAQSVPLVAGAANAPVFVMDDGDLRGGAIGGDLANWADDGRIAGEMAVRVLNGEKPEDIPILRSQNVYMFDWPALRRWGLEESNLPPGSIVLNRQPTFWETYKRFVMAGAVVLLAQMLVILGLLWQRAKRRRTEIELVGTNERLRAAMQRLRESQERLEGIITSAMDAIIAVDQEQKIVLFNASAEKMFGCSVQDAIGTPIDRFIPQRFRPAHAQHFSRFGETGVTDRPMGALGALWAVRTNGQEFPIEASISHMGGGDKKLFTVIIRDTTERKEAEEVRFRHAAIVESSDDAIISLNLDGAILSWNIGAQRMYGYAENEVLGRPIFVIVPPELQEEEQGFLEQVRAGWGMEHHETVRITKEGKPIHVSLTISPLRDWAGKIVGASKIGRDITLQKQAEATLRESEERFRIVANTAPVMIWMAGRDGPCSYFNQTWLKFTGRSVDEELGTGWTEGIHAEDVEACLETYRAAFDRRQSFEREYRLRRLDGEYRWIFDLGVPQFHPDGSFAGYIGSCIDVTERKLAEEALSTVSRRLIEAHEEERTWVARELHDDVNQRLAFLAVTLDVLKRDLPASAGEVLRRMGEVRQQIKDLGLDIQALSHRLHSSKLEYLGLDGAAGSFCREFSERQRVEIDFQSEGIPKTLPEEASLCLFRVLQEALQNAAKHSGSQHYQVSLTSSLNEVRMTISDGGIGFDAEEAMKGRGIGITSMRERLKLVDGELSIDSEPHKGTVVHARVPIRRGAMSAAAGKNGG